MYDFAVCAYTFQPRDYEVWLRFTNHLRLDKRIKTLRAPLMLRRAEARHKLAEGVMWNRTTGALPWGIVSVDALVDVARRCSAETDVTQTPSIVVNAAHCGASIALAT